MHIFDSFNLEKKNSYFLEIVCACVVFYYAHIYEVEICYLMYTKAFVFTHIYQKKCLSILITCVFHICKIFNATNRFLAEQSIKKAPIWIHFHTVFVELHNAWKISGTACKSTGPPGSGLVKGFWLAAQENIDIQTIYVYMHIYVYI